MNNIEEFIEDIVKKFVLVPLGWTTVSVVLLGRKILKIIIAIFTLILFVICLLLINSQIHEIRGLVTIFFIVLTGVCIVWISSKSKIVGIILSLILFVASILFAATIWSPGWKSTLASCWKHSDNSTFNNFEEGEDMTTKIQNDFKEEEKIKDQKVEELLQKGDRKGALKLLRGHVEEGEDLKSDLNDIDSLKRRSKQISSEIDKRTTQSQQITSTVPSFQQKTLHVKKKERLVTGLKMMQHCSIKYDYNEKITSLKVKDANGNLVKVNKEGTYGNVDYADIVVYGGDEEVDVTITVEL